MDGASLISPKVSLILPLPPSCVQFCPAHPHFFVVGTYNLEKDDVPQAEKESFTGGKTQSRNGSLIVFRTDGQGLSQEQALSQPSALLDLRFHPEPGKQDILATVSSTGSLSIFRLDPVHDPSSPLQHLATSRCDDVGEDVLFLQCNWHPKLWNIIAVTTSSGLARILFLDVDWKIERSADLTVQNSLEAWSIALSPHNPVTDRKDTQTTIYCGGDDSMLRYASCLFDQYGDVSVPYDHITLRSQHDAGVTAILPLTLLSGSGGRLVLTGSYDEHLRVFAVHDLHETYGLQRVQLMADLHLGGGVWRLDLVDTKSSGAATRIRLLASCMHAGARLVEVSLEEGRVSGCDVLARVEEHKSMNYGSDSMPEDEDADGSQLRCVSTSFYDRLLCLWEYT